MTALLLACALSAPAWTGDYGLSPKPTATEITGPEEAASLVVLPSPRKATLTVKGPGTLVIRAHAVMKAKGAKLSPPGKLVIWVGSAQRRSLDLAGEALTGWFISGKPTLRLGEAAILKVPLADGVYEVSISHTGKTAPGLYALAVAVEAPTPPPGEVAAVSPPTPPEPPPAPTPPPPEEPALATSPVEPEEPTLVAGPTVEAAPGVRPPADAARHVIAGARGADEFLVARTEATLRLALTGPGALILELHAHRREGDLRTLEPAVLGVLLDDVLVQTLALDGPVDPGLTVAGADYGLSERLVVRLPVPLGEHTLELTLSDNAVLGASVRPRMVATNAEEPDVLDLGTARRGDLRAEAPTLAQPAFGLSAFGGVWAPNAMTQVGAGGWLSAGWAVPVAASRLWLELGAGLGRAELSQRIEDPSGAARVWMRASAVPILATATWSAALPLSRLHLDAGLGGGAVVSWVEARYRRIPTRSGTRVSPAGTVHAGIAVDVGPGAVVARFQIIAALPFNTPAVVEYDPGWLSGLLGYRVELGD